MDDYSKGAFFYELQKISNKDVIEEEKYKKYFDTIYDLCDLKNIDMDTIIFKYCGKGYSELKLIEYLLNKGKKIKNIIYFDLCVEEDLILKTHELLNKLNYKDINGIECINNYKDYHNILYNLNTSNIFIIGIQPQHDSRAVNRALPIEKRTEEAEVRAKNNTEWGKLFIDTQKYKNIKDILILLNNKFLKTDFNNIFKYNDVIVGTNEGLTKEIKSKVLSMDLNYFEENAIDYKDIINTIGGKKKRKMKSKKSKKSKKYK